MQRWLSQITCIWLRDLRLAHWVKVVPHQPVWDQVRSPTVDQIGAAYRLWGAVDHLRKYLTWVWWTWIWSSVKPEDEEQHFQVFEGMVVPGGWRLMMWKRSVGGLWNMWKKGHDRTWRQWFTKDSFEFDDETSFEDQTPLKMCQCPGDHLREWKCHNIDANSSKSIQLLQHVNKSSLFFLKHYNEGDYLNN